MNDIINDLTFNSILSRIVTTSVNLPELKARLEERPYRAIDTDVHPKILADWNRKGLLMIKPERNKMHRFSVTDFVWVKFIEKMREYNFPISAIRSFKDGMISTAMHDYLDRLTPSILFNMMKDMDGIKEDPQRLKEYLKTIDIKTLMLASMPAGLASGNMLELFIMLALFLQTPISFLLDHEGKGIIFNPLMLEDGLYDNTELSSLFSKSFVSISLTEILSDALVLSKIDILHGQLMIISDQEANVLHALRENDLLSVHVRFDNENQMDLMEVKKLQKADREKRIMELMLKDGYQNIKMVTQHGKIVRCENTRKVKLK